MKILVTNDDGIHAKGLITLAETLATEHDVTIVAPDTERSAVSHGLTIHHPLFVSEVDTLAGKGFAVSGTPADCVKLGMDKLMNHRPDIVVSGINKGSNTGLNVFYSGTVAAAMEAAFAGIPAIAVSICSFSPGDYGFCARFVKQLLHLPHIKRIPEHVMLNINVPDLDETCIKGCRITHQSRMRFRDRYQRRVSPGGMTYYWLDGDYPDEKPDRNSDEAALSDGWISVTPLTPDFNVREPPAGNFEQWLQTLDLPEKFCLLR